MASASTVFADKCPDAPRADLPVRGDRTRTAAAAAGLVIVAALLSYPALGDWFRLSPDSFQYLTNARTLAETGHFPPERLMAPPGFPTVLGPFLMLGDTPFLPMRVLFSGCLALAGVLTYLLHRRGLGHRLAWVAGLLVVGHPVLLNLSTRLLSESVYLAVLTASLVLLDTWWRRPVGRWPVVVLGGLLTAAVILLRSVGFVLWPVMAATLVRHRGVPPGKRAMWLGLFVVCSLGPAAAWHVRQSAYPPGLHYMQTWTAARPWEGTDATGLALQIERFVELGPVRLAGLKEIILSRELAWRSFRSPLDMPTTWLIGGFFIVVTAVRCIRHRCPVAVFAMLTLLLLSLWPWREGVRLVAPLIPIFVGYPLWVGRVWWQRARSGTLQKTALILALVLLLVAQAGAVGIIHTRRLAARAKAVQRLAAMADLAAWHEAHTSKGTRWLGVTPDRHNGKVLLLGAAYLSRRPLDTVDVLEGQSFALRSTAAPCVLLHEILFDGQVDHRGYTAFDRIGEFVALAPAKNHPPP